MARPSSPRTAAPSAVTHRRVRCSTIAPSEATLAAGFVAWLVRGGGADELDVDGEDQPTVAMTTALGGLSTSRIPLPPEAAATLGVSDGTSIGTAAVELLLAVHDPVGPRCSSYLDAVRYLRELHHDEFDPNAVKPTADKADEPTPEPPCEASAWLAAYALGLVYGSKEGHQRLADLLHMVGGREDVLYAALQRLRTVELADPQMREQAMTLLARGLAAHRNRDGQRRGRIARTA